MDLSKLETGESGIVKSLQPHQLSVKLSEMGLLPGRKITVLFKAPFGDPIAIDVGGYVLSLRRSEAQIITLMD
ncbi:MAG: ferrous iron transport protein A [Flavobacteriales bacterium]|nr:ferrous iron transport protein A [Flavobacteriales bacterium]